MARGDYQSARRLLYPLEEYFRRHPQQATIWLDLGYKESARRHYLRAIDDLDRYLQFAPHDARALEQRAYDVAAITPPPPDLAARFYADVKSGNLTAAISNGNAYLAANSANNAFAVDLAYAEIEAGDLSAADRIVRSRMPYLRSASTAAQVLAALFYAYNQRKQYAAAIAYGTEYLALRPADDAFAMYLSYADLNNGDIEAARAIARQRAAYFRTTPKAASLWMALSYRDAAAKRYPTAVADVDTYLSFDPSDAGARAQRTAYANAIWGGARYQNFGYVQYEQRFQDTFVGMDQTYALAPAAAVQPYAAFYLSEDTRSGPPGSPQIYSDNALIADLGVRSRLGAYATAFVEGGAGIGLRGQGTISDLRYGMRYFEQWGARTQAYTSVNASAAFYSRYAGNFIGYYTVLHDFGGRSIRPLAGINGGLDSHNVFGNNYVEGVAGFQTGTNALTFRLLQVEGTYLTRGLAPAPKAPYSSLRGSIFFGFGK
jgi:hypothetical protein